MVQKKQLCMRRERIAWRDILEKNHNMTDIYANSPGLEKTFFRRRACRPRDILHLAAASPMQPRLSCSTNVSLPFAMLFPRTPHQNVKGQPRRWTAYACLVLAVLFWIWICDLSPLSLGQEGGVVCSGLPVVAQSPPASLSLSVQHLDFFSTFSTLPVQIGTKTRFQSDLLSQCQGRFYGTNDGSGRSRNSNRSRG